MCPSKDSTMFIFSYALKTIKHAHKLQNFPRLVEAIREEREILKKAWDKLEVVAEGDFIYTMRQLQDPTSRNKLFNSEEFLTTHNRLQLEVIKGLVVEEDWGAGYFAPLVYLEVLHAQILSLWASIFDLGHNGQLRLLEATGP